VSKKPPEERKPESMIFEEESGDTIFNEDEQNPRQESDHSIELFKYASTTNSWQMWSLIKEPEECLKNVEDRVYKTSVDDFVVKPVVVGRNQSYQIWIN